MREPDAPGTPATLATPSHRGAMRVALIYALFASLWIFGSDWLLGRLITDAALFAQVSAYKGWAFIAITSLLLHRVLRFESPAAVHQRDGTYVPFPLPQPLVMSWFDRWQECAGAEAALPALDAARLAEALRVSEYELKTVSVRQWRRDAAGRRREWPQIGCVGALTLDGRRLSAAERATVAALVDFAFYCGSGHHTTMGMGQTRVGG